MEKKRLYYTSLELKENFLPQTFSDLTRNSMEKNFDFVILNINGESFEELKKDLISSNNNLAQVSLPALDALNTQVSLINLANPYLPNIMNLTCEKKREKLSEYSNTFNYMFPDTEVKIGSIADYLALKKACKTMTKPFSLSHPILTSTSDPNKIGNVLRLMRKDRSGDLIIDSVPDNSPICAKSGIIPLIIPKKVA